MPVMDWSEEHVNTIVTSAFSALLGRQPDDVARDFYVDHLLHGRLSVEDFLRQVLASTEFKENSRAYGYTTDEDAVIQGSLAQPAVRDLSSRLGERVEASSAHFADLVSASGLPITEIPGQAEYVLEHRQRFFELFQAAALLTEHIDHPRILEFGASGFSTLYRRLLPGCRLVLADRPMPEECPGFRAMAPERLGNPEAFIEVDLTGPLGPAAEALDRHGPYDLVVFTEVLEHLARNPIEVMRFLLGRAASRGCVYVTTPNAFARGKLHLIGRRRNPQQMFPPRDANWDAHHHVREYSMSELIEIVEAAGGRVRALYFSSCWDEPEYLDYVRRHPDERGNLVIVASPS